jgi:tetratricopeptide (TPR) repeat protein
MGKATLAKKALKLGLEQHPKSTGLKLVQVEMLVYDDKLDQAEKLLNELFAIEPTNEEIFIQKANIYSKRDNHEKAVEFLQTALIYTEDYADVYNLIGMEYLFMDSLELAKENFIKCLEEDFEDQSALYNVVYCHEFLDQNQEAIDYWINKNENDLERIDNFIFMQSGFKTVKEYVDDCKNRIVYQVKRMDDLKSMLKLGEKNE